MEYIPASMSILNKDLTLNIDKTITHAEMVIDFIIFQNVASMV